jgi:hypothetical protein
LQIKLDGEAGTRVAIDTKFYQHLDHGPANKLTRERDSKPEPRGDGPEDDFEW